MANIGKPRSPKGLAKFCAKLAEEKLAHGIAVLEIKDIEYAPADYFVVCSCDSSAQVSALVDLTLRKAKELGMGRVKTEGTENLYWVLIDFFDVVFHIMLSEARSFYRLERLWGDGKFSKLNDAGNLVAMSADDLKSIY